MNTRETAKYLQEQHGIDVSQALVLKWLNRGYVNAIQGENKRWNTTEEDVDLAVESHSVPPKVGRKRKFSREDRLKMVRMCNKHTMKEVAAMFGCDISLISRIRKGTR